MAFASAIEWLRARDRGLAALRRAGRAAIVMPAVFALGEELIGDPAVATFAGFGAFAMLLLVDFGGSMRERLQPQAALAVVGGVFVCVATVASRSTWLAAAAMTLVGFGVLFAGAVSSVLAAATTSLLLAFILPVSLAGPISSVPDRLAGWAIAAGASFMAVALLWPAPTSDPLRDPAIDACRALAARLRSGVAYVLGGDRASEADHDAGVARADASVGALQRAFFATPYRPSPGFRAQELSFAVSQIAANIDFTAAAERRGWMERLLGRQPGGLAGTLSAAQKRAGAHVERHSVWLHNSVRGAVALGLAVLVAKLTGVQHSFWVVLGALSVLRSNALSTGQNVVRGLLGTIAGFIVGGALVVLVGTNTTLLWLLLPPAVLLAGLAPATISFAAGQAAFTLTLLILFNIVQPIGWRLGLVRIEDVALGCAVSVVVGLLFWPRGAGAALGRALAQAYSDSVNYLASAVEFGMDRCDLSAPTRPAPAGEATHAAAASQRLDDTFRSFLAERGAKRIPLAGVTGLLTGVAGLRLAADAVLDLWQRDHDPGGDRTASREELLASTKLIVDWYSGFATSLSGDGEVPGPLPHDELADKRLIEAISRDLRREDGRASATAARMIWTADHLDATRRLQTTLVGPARAATQRSVK